MSKFKLFIENFVVYGIGGIISKVIPLLMLPIITRLMPDSFYFGLSDLSNTVVQFGSAIAVMGMYDAVFRLFFEKKSRKYQKAVCSTALDFTLFTSLIVFLVLILFRRQMAQLFFSDPKYANLIYLTAMSILIGSTNNILQIPTRTLNRRGVFLVLNTVGPVVSYAVSIPLLLSGHYVIALPLASVISALTLEISFGFINQKWFDVRLFNFGILKDLLKIAVPLMPNFLIYWIFNSCDRLMIGKLIGNSFTGIYGVGARIASVSQLIYTAFAGGWQYFAFSTMNEKDQVKSNSLVFEYLGVISFSVSLLVCVFAHAAFTILFPGEYEAGYIVVPYLFLAPLMQMLYQVICNQFLVIKKTWPNMIILGGGAVLNIFLNLLLIPRIGIEGAAIATLAGYVVSVIIAGVWLYKIELFVVEPRLFIVAGTSVAYFLIWRFFLQTHFWIALLFALVLIACYVMLYKKDLMAVVKHGGKNDK